MGKSGKNRQDTKNIFVTIRDYILCLIGYVINNKTLKSRCNHSKTANRRTNNSYKKNLEEAIENSRCNHSKTANRRTTNYNKNLEEAKQKSLMNQVLKTLKKVHNYPGGVAESKE
jgi:intergrase/recombinase